MATGGDRASPRRAASAGALAALAGFWRPDFGLVAAAAVVAALLVRRRAPGGARAAPVAAAAAVAGTVLLWLPFAVAAGPGELWEVFVAGPAREGEFWSLPFPLVYDGPLRAWPPGDLATDVKDLLGYELPLAGVVALAAARAHAPAARSARCSPGLLVLGAGMAVYLFSRPDEQHAQPLLIAACAFVPIALAARPARPLAAVLALALALLLAVGAANRLSALVLPPDLEPVRLDGVPGIRVPPDEARALPPMVALVQRLVPPGEPIYVAPRRSDLVTLSAPLVHFLVDRPNLLEDDVLLQARPAEQQRIVAALRREPPARRGALDRSALLPPRAERPRAAERVAGARRAPRVGLPPARPLRGLRRAGAAMRRLALAVIALAVAGWLASAWPGTRAELRARDIQPAAGQELTPARVQEAIGLLEDARRARPDGEVVPRLAGLELTAGRPERAVALLRPLVRHEPENVTAWTALALALADSDPEAAAEADARRRALAPPVEP